VRVYHVLWRVVQNVLPHIPRHALLREPGREALSEIMDPDILQPNFLTQSRHGAAHAFTVDVRLAGVFPLRVRVRSAGKKARFRHSAEARAEVANDLWC